MNRKIIIQLIISKGLELSDCVCHADDYSFNSLIRYNKNKVFKSMRDNLVF